MSSMQQLTCDVKGEMRPREVAGRPAESKAFVSRNTIAASPLLLSVSPALTSWASVSWLESKKSTLCCGSMACSTQPLDAGTDVRHHEPEGHLHQAKTIAAGTIATVLSTETFERFETPDAVWLKGPKSSGSLQRDCQGHVLTRCDLGPRSHFKGSNTPIASSAMTGTSPGMIRLCCIRNNQGNARVHRLSRPRFRAPRAPQAIFMYL